MGPIFSMNSSILRSSSPRMDFSCSRNTEYCGFLAIFLGFFKSEKPLSVSAASKTDADCVALRALCLGYLIERALTEKGTCRPPTSAPLCKLGLLFVNKGSSHTVYNLPPLDLSIWCGRSDAPKPPPYNSRFERIASISMERMLERLSGF